MAYELVEVEQCSGAADSGDVDVAAPDLLNFRVWRILVWAAKDPGTAESPGTDLQRIQFQWEHALRKAVLELPDVTFDEGGEEKKA